MGSGEHDGVAISPGTLEEWAWIAKRIVVLSTCPFPYMFQEPYRSIRRQADLLLEEIERHIPEEES